MWTAIAPRPRLGERPPGQPQQIDIKHVTIEESAASHPSPLAVPPAGHSSAPEIETIETSKFIVEFSNMGGTLSNVYMKEYGSSLPIRGMGGTPGYDSIEFIAERMGSREILYRYKALDLTIERQYTVSEDDYTIEVKTLIQNPADMSKLILPETQALILDMSNLEATSSGHAQDRSLFEYVISAASGTERKGNAFKFSSKEQKKVAGSVSWVGFRSRYFCAITKPAYDTDGYGVTPLNDNMLQINVHSKAVNLAPQENATFSSLIFVGPEKTDLLAKYKSGFEDIKRYYRITLFDAIAKIIYGALNTMYKIVPNWGVCVIVISMIIYLAMYPLTLRSMLSMRKMQALQPKIASIREKYRDNPQKMNIEMMELYKKNQINPLGGCLPMLLQMPVFIGLYQVLWRSVSFKGAHFLWIKDLSEPDRLIILPLSLPFIENEINLLPILMIFVMAFQQKLTSKSMGTMDPAQATQQKMMAVIMPIFLGAIFYHFASGLTLYFTVFYILSTLAQWKMSKVSEAA